MRADNDLMILREIPEKIRIHPRCCLQIVIIHDHVGGPSHRHLLHGPHPYPLFKLGYHAHLKPLPHKTVPGIGSLEGHRLVPQGA